MPKRFAVMGAGEVGVYLARSLSSEGHRVTVIDSDPSKRQLVEEQLDAAFVLGNGAHVPTLEAAEVGDCELFVAASASDEANLVASLLAKRLGAPRSVVRVATSEDVTRYGRTYETAFAADLLLSTELLTTTRILNTVLGYNTLEVEYLAGGAIQVRRIHVEDGSLLQSKRLADVSLPSGSLVLAFVRNGALRVPRGEDRAEPGDEALVLGTSQVIDEVERRVSGHSRRLGLVVMAGGGRTAQTVAAGLARQTRTLKIIESNRERAEALAAAHPDYEIVHGDATDLSVLNSEGVSSARAFIALTGQDEINLMACLLAQELGVQQLSALVQKSETSSLWRKVGTLDVVSPRIVRRGAHPQLHRERLRAPRVLRERGGPVPPAPAGGPEPGGGNTPRRHRDPAGPDRGGRAAPRPGDRAPRRRAPGGRRRRGPLRAAGRGGPGAPGLPGQ